MKKIPLEVKIGVLLIITVVIMLSAGFLTYRNMSSMVSSILKQARPDLSLVSLKEISSNLTDADNSVRLFMVTGDDSYLKPYYRIISAMDSSLNLLYKYSENSPEQLLLIDSVSHLITDKIDVWDQLLNLRNNTNVTHALDLLSKKFLSVPEKDKADTLDEKRSVIRRFFSHKRENEEPAGIEPSALKAELTQIEKLQAQDSIKQVKVRKQELSLLQHDRELTTHLAALILTIENDENIHFKQKADEADLSAGLTYRWLILLGVSVFFLLLIVLIVILNYVRKTNATQNALTDAKNEAENLAKAKELFVANVSHEMRSPMNAISGLSEQLMEFQVDEKLREQLMIIRRSSDHLLGIINEILDFSKIQAGKISLEKIDFYLTDVIEEVLQLTMVLAMKKQLEIKSSIEKGLPEVMVGDPVRLKQILQNLLSNAVKFTEEGMVSLVVNKKEQEEQILWLEFIVTDTGIGIENDKLDDIFEDFSQEETSTARQYGGTGLGLSIVKRLVGLMGGDITVDSKKNAGSVFTVALPLQIGKKKKTEKKTEQIVQKEILDFRNLSVLIADDEEFNKVLLRMILKKWNVKYHEVSNGKEAVEETKNHRYDLVLMDIRMPVMDGITATRHILEDTSSGHIPKIIGVSATSANQDVKKCREAGMTDFISKPYREDALKKVMLRVSGITTHETAGKEGMPMDDAASEKKKMDLKALYHLGDGDQQFIKDLLNMFILNSEKSLVTMEEALKNQEWEKIADEAHRLASPSLHLNALDFHELLKKMEYITRNRTNLSQLPGLLADCQKEREVIVGIIREHLNEL